MPAAHPHRGRDRPRAGKSALALALAEEFGGTIINADSMQVYRDLRVLTARPGADAEARAPHRLYGVIDAAEACSAGRWRGLALAEIAAARAGGKPADSGRRHRALLSCRSSMAWPPVPPIPDCRARGGAARFMPAAAAPGSTPRSRRAIPPQRRGSRPATRSASCAPTRWSPPPAGRSANGSALPRTGAHWRVRRHRPAAAACRALCRVRCARFAAMMDGGAVAEVAALLARAAAARSAGDEGGRRARDRGLARRPARPRGSRCCSAASDAALCQAAIHLAAPSHGWAARLTHGSAIFGKFTSRNFCIYSSTAIDRPELAD